MKLIYPKQTILATAAIALMGCSGSASGQSDADSTLQKDVKNMLAAKVQGQCDKPLKITDQKVTKRTTGKQPWKEVWTVNVCGKSVDYPITFTPDAEGSGTGFTIG